LQYPNPLDIEKKGKYDVMMKQREKGKQKRKLINEIATSRERETATKLAEIPPSLSRF